LIFRRNGYDLGAERGDLGFSARERVHAQAAIGAPMPAVEGDDDRALLEKARQAHETPRLVAQEKRRHGLAGPGRRHADAIIR
jgi:hypothetical protein